MDTIAHSVRTLIEYGLWPFDALSALWSLTLVSIITGIIMLWAVKWTTPQRRVERARAQIASAVYEMRLFLDSLRRVLVAQGRLLGWSLAYVAYMVPAFVVLAIPLGLAYVHLDARHGLDALPTDAPVLIRVDLDPAVDGERVALDTAPGVTVTAPPLYSADEQRVYFRVSIAEPDTHRVTIRVGDHRVIKQLSADPRAPWVTPERTRGVATWWSIGSEAPLPPDSGVRAVTLTHPETPQRWLGLAIPWWLYWLIIATVAALLLRRPFGVVL